MAALLYGLNLCANRGFSNFWVEIDPTLLTKYIKREWNSLWKMNGMVQDARKSIDMVTILVIALGRLINLLKKLPI